MTETGRGWKICSLLALFPPRPLLPAPRLPSTTAENPKFLFFSSSSALNPKFLLSTSSAAAFFSSIFFSSSTVSLTAAATVSDTRRPYYPAPLPTNTAGGVAVDHPLAILRAAELHGGDDARLARPRPPLRLLDLPPDRRQLPSRLLLWHVATHRRARRV